MKILIATPFYPPQTGVLATYAAGIGDALVRKGHDARVVVLNTSLPAGVRQIVFMGTLLRRIGRTDLVLSLDMTSVGVASYLIARLTRTPLAFRIGGDSLWEHFVERTGERIRLSDFYGTEPELSRVERKMHRMFSRMLRRAHHIFFNTRFQKDIWMKEYALDDARCSVLENYYPGPRIAAVPEKRVFVSANRRTLYKNDSVLRAAFARVQARHPDIGLDTEIVPHAQQLERLTRCYATIVPSISEVGSNIAIESVSYGRPFIMSEDTGTKERLGDCGLYVDTRSLEALTHAIESLLEPETYKRLSAAARNFSFKHTWDDIAEEILDVIVK